MTANAEGARGMRHEARVGVVGAGPAGLTMAWHLHRLGIRDLTVFDASSDIGGQSVTREVDGVPVELGTCYMSAGYLMAGALAGELGCTVEHLPPATMVGTDGREGGRHELPLGLIARYLALWSRWYLRGQMHGPTRPENAARFDRWLRDNGLEPLVTDFTFSAGLTAQLYGPVGSVSAHSGLNWLRPSLFFTGRFSRTYAVAEGYQTLWKRLAGSLGLGLETGSRVDAVHPGPDGPVVVRQDDRRTFDLVFVACPLDSVAHPLSHEVQESGPFEHTDVYSAIWRGRGWPAFAPSRCYLPSCFDGTLGRVLTVRRNGERDGVAVGQLCAYALSDRTREDHRERAVADLRTLGLGDLDVVEDRLWRYNVRYSAAQLRSGLPGMIDDAQGRDGIWYGGGALSHWNVDAITDFNHGLALRMASSLGLGWRRRLALFRLDQLVKDL